MEAAKIMKCIISAVAYIHEKAVIHRDLKTANILIDDQNDLDTVKIIDFGLAAPVQGRDGSGYLKTALGTFGYMAPEIHLGRKYKGEQVDVFALGVILFVMFSKHPPFNAATP